MENKDNLISRKYLYDKIAELEEDVRKTIVHQPKGSPEYLRCQSRLNELNEFKSEVRDAPTVTDTNVGSKWIPCSERLPDIEFENELNERGHNAVLPLLVTREVFSPIEGTGLCVEKRFYFKYKGKKTFYDIEIDEVENVIAWMPLPEPYKGE